ncbi:MAG: DUF3576 domain-containing protein [Pseudomonadota bacterium]
MRFATLVKFGIVATALTAVTACGGRSFGTAATARPAQYTDPTNPNNLDTQNTIWNAFNRQSTETNVLVNRYIWAASLQVLDFLPIQTVDPYTGVIVTGFGAPPNGGRAYRATVLINDPALDARSLNVALQTRGGPASPATVRAVEDAILTRARQLRIADNRL